MPELAHHALRTTVKKKGPRKAATPDTEPDLYAFKSLPDPCTETENPKKIENHCAQKSVALTPPPIAAVPDVVEVPTSSFSTAGVGGFVLPHVTLRMLAQGLVNPTQINTSFPGQISLSSALLDPLQLSTYYLANSLTAKQASSFYSLPLATVSKVNIRG